MKQLYSIIMIITLQTMKLFSIYHFSNEQWSMGHRIYANSATIKLVWPRGTRLQQNSMVLCQWPISTESCIARPHHPYLRVVQRVWSGYARLTNFTQNIAGIEKVGTASADVNKTLQMAHVHGPLFLSIYNAACTH